MTAAPGLRQPSLPFLHRGMTIHRDTCPARPRRRAQHGRPGPRLPERDHLPKSAGSRRVSAVAGIRPEWETTDSEKDADGRDPSRVARRRDGLGSAHLKRPDPAAFVLAGAAGAGKTRLAAEAATSAAAAGFTTAQAVGSRAAAGVPGRGGGLQVRRAGPPGKRHDEAG